MLDKMELPHNRVDGIDVALPGYYLIRLPNQSHRIAAWKEWIGDFGQLLHRELDIKTALSAPSASFYVLVKSKSSDIQRPKEPVSTDTLLESCDWIGAGHALRTDWDNLTFTFWKTDSAYFNISTKMLKQFAQMVTAGTDRLRVTLYGRSLSARALFPDEVVNPEPIAGFEVGYQTLIYGNHAGITIWHNLIAKTFDQSYPQESDATKQRQREHIKRFFLAKQITSSARIKTALRVLVQPALRDYFADPENRANFWRVVFYETIAPEFSIAMPDFFAELVSAVKNRTIDEVVKKFLDSYNGYRAKIYDECTVVRFFDDEVQIPRPALIRMLADAKKPNTAKDDVDKNIERFLKSFDDWATNNYTIHTNMLKLLQGEIHRILRISNKPIQPCLLQELERGMAFAVDERAPDTTNFANLVTLLSNFVTHSGRHVAYLKKSQARVQDPHGAVAYQILSLFDDLAVSHSLIYLHRVYCETPGIFDLTVRHIGHSPLMFRPLRKGADGTSVPASILSLG